MLFIYIISVVVYFTLISVNVPSVIVSSTSGSKSKNFILFLGLLIRIFIHIVISQRCEPLSCKHTGFDFDLGIFPFSTTYRLKSFFILDRSFIFKDIAVRF